MLTTIPTKTDYPRRNYVLAVLCAIVFIAVFIQSLNISFVGDDLAYSRYDQYYEGSIFQYPRWILRHWVHTNGRSADCFAPILLYILPMWVTALLNAAINALMFYLGSYLVGMFQKSRAMQIVMFILMAFTLPWWDSSILFMVSLNYVWATAFGLAFIIILLKKEIPPRISAFLYYAMAFIAGSAHEAMSLPLLCGLVAYYFFTGDLKMLPRRKKIYLAAFFVGVLMCIFAPSILSRAAAAKEADDPILALLLKSDFYALALLGAIIVAFIASWKSSVKLLKRPFVIFAVAAIASMCISAYGGIVGRSGWFAQIFALVAFMWWIPSIKVGHRVSTCITVLALVSTTFVMTATTVWQIRLNNELKESQKLFEDSQDGTFFMDFTPIEDVPVYTLCRPRGAVSNNDVYNRFCIYTYTDSTKQYAILPIVLKSIVEDASPIAETMTDVGYLSPTPKSTKMELEKPYFGLWADENNEIFGEVKCCVDGREFYFSERIHPVPGDRYRLD